MNRADVANKLGDHLIKQRLPRLLRRASPDGPVGLDPSDPDEAAVLATRAEMAQMKADAREKRTTFPERRGFFGR